MAIAKFVLVGIGRGPSRDQLIAEIALTDDDLLVGRPVILCWLVALVSFMREYGRAWKGEKKKGEGV